MASHNTSSELTGFSCFAVHWEQLSKMVGRYCKRHGTRISVGLLIQELHSKTGNRHVRTIVSRVECALWSHSFCALRSLNHASLRPFTFVPNVIEQRPAIVWEQRLCVPVDGAVSVDVRWRYNGTDAELRGSFLSPRGPARCTLIMMYYTYHT